MAKTNGNFTAKEVKPRTVVFTGIWEKDIQLMIRRGMAWCAYVGIPMKYRITKNYNDIDIECHGGLTFGEKGVDDSEYKKGYFWYGWDYGHFGDYVHYSVEMEGKKFDKRTKDYKAVKTVFNEMNKSHKENGDKDWKLSEVVSDLFDVAEQFNKIVKGRIKEKKLKTKK